ncbi:MAG: hypothetical protein ACRC2R_10910, partial [Xenococcaceae cyanobacterium]
VIDRLEDNQKVFANRLAQKEKSYPNFYYQEEKNKLYFAIADIKKSERRDRFNGLGLTQQRD